MFTSFPLTRSQARTHKLKCHAEPDNRPQGRHQMAEKGHGNGMFQISAKNVLTLCMEGWKNGRMEDERQPPILPPFHPCRACSDLSEFPALTSKTCKEVSETCRFTNKSRHWQPSEGCALRRWCRCGFANLQICKFANSCRAWQ